MEVTGGLLLRRLEAGRAHGQRPTTAVRGGADAHSFFAELNWREPPTFLLSCRPIVSSAAEYSIAM